MKLLSRLKSVPWIYDTAKFRAKNKKCKNFKTWTKIVCAWVLLGWILKKKLYLKPALSKLRKDKVSLKQKNHKFWIKIDVFGYFWAEILKNNFYIKPSLSDLWNCKVLLKMKKSLIWVFLAKNLKKLFTSLKSAPSNLTKVNLWPKQHILT